MSQAVTGHDTECMCPSCLMADMTAHLRNTFGADADRLIVKAGMIPATAESVRTRFAQPGQRCGTGYVRKISDAQARYLGRLLRTRDYSSLIERPWFTIDIDNISLAGARTMIDALLGCPERTNVVEPASDAQRRYLASLLAERAHEYGDVDVENIDRRRASNMIGALKAAPRRAVEAAATATPVDVKIQIGIYALGDEIYRMRKARTGSHLYAERLTDEETGAWEYARGMARRVPSEGRKLTLEECEALSLKVGGCCMCGRELTATVDGVGPAARFIGPVCASKMGY